MGSRVIGRCDPTRTPNARCAKCSSREPGSASGKVSGTAKREPKCCTHLLHPLITQAGDALAQALLGHSYGIVQVYRAPALHPVVYVQNDLRRHVTDRGGYRGYRYSRKVAYHAVASEYQDWPLLVRRRELANVNVTAVQSSGQAAASSQRRYSSAR